MNVRYLRSLNMHEHNFDSKMESNTNTKNILHGKILPPHVRFCFPNYCFICMQASKQDIQVAFAFAEQCLLRKILKQLQIQGYTWHFIYRHIVENGIKKSYNI